MPSYTYNELLGDLSPASGTFSQTGAGASVEYLFTPPGLGNARYAALQNSVTDVLGTTGTRPTDGRIQRKLPVRHPLYQWLFADSVSYQGVGSQYATVTPSAGPGSAIIPQVPVFETYKVRVQYGPRHYNCWQDKDISVFDSVFYDKAGGALNFRYATEWYRFTSFEHYPTNNFLQAQQGQMVFRAAGPGGAVAPNGTVFQDAPKLYMPDSVLKVRWYQVPYRYLTSKNSFLVRFVGHINQNRFGYPAKGNTLEPYAPGSLLYHGATPLQVYTPPVPDEGILAFNFGDGFKKSKLCDLELTFSYTARKLGTSTANVPDFSSVNRNWIVGGWNLQAWFTTRKFYYVSSFDPAAPNDQSKWFPPYNSFPFELLFTDPDIAQPFGEVNP